jgi:hypothetical protein
MANQLLTVNEVTRLFLKDIDEAYKKDPQSTRRWLYMVQTSLGGFPDTVEAREKFGIKGDD